MRTGFSRFWNGLKPVPTFPHPRCIAKMYVGTGFSRFRNGLKPVSTLYPFTTYGRMMVTALEPVCLPAAHVTGGATPVGTA